MIPGFCRDCLTDAPPAGARCTACRSPRLIRHPEIDTLAIAHIDCDAFYATVEKRDDPSIADKPVIIGGGKRGVVSAACYISRTFGVRSAMPMFEAMRLCPQAVVIRPDMAKYVAVGRQVREAMRALTPLVEPLSIDEAFLDLSGTQRLHGASAAKTLAKLAIEVERDIGITVSIGLSGNKFLAKIASDLDKPRGFAVLGLAEAAAFLAPRPVSFIYGVGKAMEARLQNDGYRLISDLQRADEIDLMRRYGVEGRRLARLAHGTDVRVVDPSRETKSVSAETTFNKDIADFTALERILWALSERVSRRLKKQELAGSTINVKLKTADFRTRTRAASLSNPTQLAARIFDTGRELLKRETDGTSYRLVGIGVSALVPANEADPANLMDRRTVDAEHAVDRLRAKFGDAAVVRGLAFDKEEES
ncbi:MAG: DNA-directed polymerase [Xanthobacteraceae bacterium]|nr:DNA-directed polymerase [Xanthobacteraceae bacterium]